MAPLIPILAELVPEVIRYFAGAGAGAVADKVGEIAMQVTGAKTVDAAAEAIKLDPNVALQFKTAVLNQELDLRRLSLQEAQLYIDDTKDARKYRDDNVFWLGVSVLVTFTMVIGAVLYGGYNILKGGVTVEAGMFAAITGFIGTLVGYVAANAQQVIGFFFGSSKGSGDKTDAMAEAIKSFNVKKGS